MRLSLLLLLAAAAAALPAPHSSGAEDAALPEYHFVPRPLNWMNDPNGPFYDPVYRKYHLMYQYLTPRTWGHAVSDDLLHWTQLPIALDTDEWYDKGGVYTGSATVLNDADSTPVLTYSVSTNDMQCLAYPTNRSDPLLVKWTKFAGNPVISTKAGALPGRDDTTAWLGQDGQWRMVYGTDQGANAYTSTDFKTWTHVGMLNTDDPSGMWECPDFFEVPGSNGTWVLKASTLGRDFWATGTYDDRAVRFTRRSADIATTTQLYDHGHFYASKSFYDPVRRRQVLWGWIPEERSVDEHGQPYGWASVMSLPREMVLGPDGIQLLTRPIAELASLRDNSSHISLGPLVVPAGTVLALPLQGQRIEVVARLVPGTSCGIQALWSEGGEYTRMGVANNSQTQYMPGVDLPGDDYNVTNVDYQDPRTCQAECARQAQCQAWTYVVRPPKYASCCLKSSVPQSDSSPTCTSGVKQPQAGLSIVGDTTHSSLNTRDQHAATRATGPIPLPAQPATVDLHLYVDHSILELFINDGVSAITRRAYPTLPDALGLGLYAEGSACAFESVDAWVVNPTPLTIHPMVDLGQGGRRRGQ